MEELCLPLAYVKLPVLAAVEDGEEGGQGWKPGDGLG